MTDSKASVLARIAAIRRIPKEDWDNAAYTAGPASRHASALDYAEAICEAVGVRLGDGPQPMPREPGSDDE